MTEKYRAKRKDIDKWVCGRSLLQTESGTYILPDMHTLCGQGFNGNLVSIDVDEAEFYEIQHATLSRGSGLTACGQDVYEGDILRIHLDHTTEFWTAVVRFGWHDTYEYGWYLEPIRDTVFTKRIGAWLGFDPAFGSTAVVVGNVWDNPEMMKK